MFELCNRAVWDDSTLQGSVLGEKQQGRKDVNIEILVELSCVGHHQQGVSAHASPVHVCVSVCVWCVCV